MQRSDEPYTLLLRADEVSAAEQAFVIARGREEFIEQGLLPPVSGVDFVHESSLKSLLNCVIDAIEGRHRSRDWRGPPSPLFFVRRVGRRCTGIARLLPLKRAGVPSRGGTDLQQIELLSFAAHKGTGAALHFEMCRALSLRGCAQINLNLKTCVWRAGGAPCEIEPTCHCLAMPSRLPMPRTGSSVHVTGFYLKQGWEYPRSAVTSSSVGDTIVLLLSGRAWERAWEAHVRAAPTRERKTKRSSPMPSSLQAEVVYANDGAVAGRTVASR